MEKGLKAGAVAYQAKAWWISVPSNWNLVCNGGLAMGALALIDEEPELTQAILDTATANLPLTMASFQPDGAWEAGPDYWAYTCRYAAFTIEALKTTLGKDFNLSQAPGFSRTAFLHKHTFQRSDQTSVRHRNLQVGIEYGEACPIRPEQTHVNLVPRKQNLFGRGSANWVKSRTEFSIGGEGEASLNCRA